MVLALLWLLVVTSAAAPIVLNGDVIDRRYDGHGGLSAGASSRLLFDYPEKERSDILDFLFKPSFGANLHICKVEIGGDVQSTDGSEASHMHARGDLNYERGYEWWLMAEAKKRNPDVLTYALSWGVPGWVGHGSFFSDDNIDYQVAFVRGARDVYNITIDYIGIWNERSWGNPQYVVSLRNALDVAGFRHTTIVGADGGIPDDQILALKSDSDFSLAEPILGRHYPCSTPEPPSFWELKPAKTFWANEDYSTVADWTGAGCWGRSLNQNYVKLNATSTIAWSTIWSVYDSWQYFGNGLMYAYWPTSGYYEVKGAIWTSAHTTQFAVPGWRYLGGTGRGLLPKGGSWVTLVPESTGDTVAVDETRRMVREAAAGDFSLVIEKLNGDCLRCHVNTSFDESVTFELGGSLRRLGTHTLQAWLTNRTHWFERLPDVTVVDGKFTLFIVADSIMTLTTTTGQTKGTAIAPAVADLFPLPYSESYDTRRPPQPAFYHADNAGSFEIAPGEVLLQAQPLYADGTGWVGDYDPITSLGSPSWADVTAAVDIKILVPLDEMPASATSDPAILFPNATTGLMRTMSAVGDEPDPISNGAYAGVCVRQLMQYDSGYCLLVGAGLQGAPASPRGWVLQAGTRKYDRTAGIILASGMLPADLNLSAWHHVSLAAEGRRLTATLDGHVLANLSSTFFNYGLVSLRSGYHYAHFDNLRIDGRQPPNNTLFDTIVPGTCVRRDFTGPLGAAVTVTRTLTLTALGRLGPINHSHTLAVLDGNTHEILAQVEAQPSSTTDSYGFVYTTLPHPVVVEAGRFIYVVTNETLGGDSFCTTDSAATPRAGWAADVVSVYQIYGVWYTYVPGTMYGTVNARFSP